MKSIRKNEGSPDFALTFVMGHQESPDDASCTVLECEDVDGCLPRAPVEIVDDWYDLNLPPFPIPYPFGFGGWGLDIVSTTIKRWAKSTNQCVQSNTRNLRVN